MELEGIWRLSAIDRLETVTSSWFSVSFGTNRPLRRRKCLLATAVDADV